MFLVILFAKSIKSTACKCITHTVKENVFHLARIQMEFIS